MTVTGLHGGDSDTVTVSGSTCSSTGGFSDINDGTTVTVYNASGTIVATGRLGVGTGRIEEQSAQFPDIYIGSCTFPFTMQVPPSDFYQVEAAHRGRVTVRSSEIHNVRLTLTD